MNKNINLSDDWRIIDAEALMKCNDCNYQSRQYAEHDDLIEFVGLKKNSIVKFAVLIAKAGIIGKYLDPK